MLKLAVIGCGNRGRDTYGRLLLSMKDRVRVVAIAEPRADRREAMAKEHEVPAERVFCLGEELLAQEKMADAVLVCTQDQDHVTEAVRAMRRGYDVLMEKPISASLEELHSLLQVQKETGKRVVVCHVLRYTPFFRKLKETIDSGVLGDIMTVQAMENVGWWHMAHSYVRGNWRREDETTPMILAKCCHDLDYLVWLCSRQCERVSSFGSLTLFREDRAPEGAALRCMDGCRVKDECPYDCEKIYLDYPVTGYRAGNRGWPLHVLTLGINEENIRSALQEGPYGRCVYHCDNDVVDHQMVQMEMEGGAVLTLNMTGCTAKTGRTLSICGTMGEIRADMDAEIIEITPFGKSTEIVDVTKLADDFSGHGGGDKVMLAAFLDLLEGRGVHPGLTTLEASVESHLIGIAAEMSRKNCGQAVEISSIRQ